MQNKRVAVLDIGSSKMTAFVGEQGVNATYLLKGQKELEYAGYMGGEFLERDEAEKVLLSLGDHLRGVYGGEKLYVGIPGGFSKVVCRDAQLTFPKKRKITEKEINELYDRGDTQAPHGYTAINRSPIFFELDDMRKTPDALGESSVSLKGRVSYVYAVATVLDFIRSALQKTGFTDIEFVSVPLAEAMFLIRPEVRDRMAVLVDVGYIASTFTVIQGDGVLFQRSFDYGGGYLTAAISNEFDAEFDIAERVKRKATLSVKNGEYDVYEIIEGDSSLYFNKRKVSEVLKDSLDKLAEEIDESVKDSMIRLPEYLSLTVTGGGISFLRGAKEHLSDRLNMMVETVCPETVLYDKPTDSSYLSVLSLALQQ